MKIKSSSALLSDKKVGGQLHFSHTSFSPRLSDQNFNIAFLLLGSIQTFFVGRELCA